MNITHLEPLVYDYSQIADANMRTMAQRAADEIKPRLRRATEDILIIGQRLAVVREYLPHGQWMGWIETEFEMSDEAARRFINVATRFADKSHKLWDLKPSALYMLAAPSTPDEAIAEVESLVVDGHTPTVAETKQIITTVRAGLVPAPVVPAPGKLLVDWTDEDWAAAKEKEGGHKATPQQVHTQTGPRPYYEATPQPRQSDDKNDLSPQQKPMPSPAPSSMAVHFTSESEEHYTPDVVWQAAQRVMGSIVLDPCSNSHERPNIPALRHYTIAEDGLRQYWEGSVFLNPPYGRQIGEWVGKLVEAHKTFDVPQAIALLPARVDTQWWQLIRDYPVCFVTGRLKFKGNDDNPAPFPSAIVYLGQRVGDFVREFSPMGDIWRRVQ